MRLPLVCLLVLLFLGSARAEEPFLKKNDVIALVGGEDMVVAGETGYFELLLMRALPDYHLRFRSLAFEGDTVFEQNRDLNFPTLEESLDKVGATVVVCQFGQMESLGGKDKIPEFIAAYEKLLERFSGGGKRRVVVIVPFKFLSPTASVDYANAIIDLASKHNAPCAHTVEPGNNKDDDGRGYRDGIHLNDLGQFSFASFAGTPLDQKVNDFYSLFTTGEHGPDEPELHRLLALIRAKNHLWFDYWRVQNWAFLAGDRTNQPSSRDWKDPSKRWFPAEREEFLPLIESKEKEIDAQAEKLK